MAIVSTIGSFSIWEAADRWIIEIPRLNVISRRVLLLTDFEIRTELVKEEDQVTNEG